MVYAAIMWSTHNLRSLTCALLLVASTAVSCGDDATPGGPFDSIPIDETIVAAGLSGPVDVVRDRFGVPHIHATTIEDAAFVNGYMTARDRILEIDLLRHFASGTVAELFGALDAGQIDGDLEMRMHRMRPVAEETFAALQASSDPIDQEIVRVLTRYSDGVNQFVSELVDGRHDLDDAVLVWFDPVMFQPWTPVDSLVIARLQAFSLSWDTSELGRTATWQLAKEVFDQADPDVQPERARRAGAVHDLLPIRPMDHTPTIDGFPNVDGDSGTRAKRGGGAAATRRPVVPQQLLDQVRATLAPKTELARRILDPENGSNNWIVGPTLAGGKPLLANDPHLQLSNPPVFYLVHLTVPGALDVQGASFPGIPGIVLGHNARIAWGATTVSHDVEDFYLETIAPCTSGGGDCVSWGGGEVPIETWTETIKVGARGTITRELQVTYERVPHHGPIIPAIVDHDLAPRVGSTAISVRFTGHEVTNELRAVYRLAKATSVQEAFDALDDFGFGAQNWVIVDDAGDIGWTTNARVPWRTAGCFTWHRETNPEGVAPFLVVPGDGSCEWDGWMDARYIPHAINPAQDYLVTANADPVGETFDGDALDGPLVDGVPLYLNADYDAGFRTGRITRRIEALVGAGVPITLEDLGSIQADTFSSYGNVLRGPLVASIARLEEEWETPGTHPDLTEFAASVPELERPVFAEAGERLAAWSLETPAAVEGAPSEIEIADSAATSIFNAWAVFWLDEAFADEMSLIGSGAGGATRAGLAVWERPGELVTGIDPTTGEAVLCDDLSTPPIESCSLTAVVALGRALAWLRQPAAGGGGFGTGDMDAWRWGLKHRLTLESLVPSAELNVPWADDPDEPEELRDGFPRPGDQFSVDASSPGLGDLNFAYGHGPSIRHLVEFTGPASPRARIALPGGQIHDRSSPHYRDLIDEYWRKNQYFDLAWSVSEIIGVAEGRLRFE
jgi:penicillin amidase